MAKRYGKRMRRARIVFPGRNELVDIERTSPPWGRLCMGLAAVPTNGVTGQRAVFGSSRRRGYSLRRVWSLSFHREAVLPAKVCHRHTGWNAGNGSFRRRVGLHQWRVCTT